MSKCNKLKEIKKNYGEFRDSANKKLTPFMDFIYLNRVSVIIMGFCMFSFPFISIILGKFNSVFFKENFINFNDKQIVNTMLIGIILIYAGLILFGYKKEKVGDFLLFSFKIVLTFISIIILIAVDIEKPKFNFLIFLYRTSYIWMFFLFLNESVKVFLKLFKAFNKLEPSTKITIILPVLAAVISYIFKIEFNFK